MRVLREGISGEDVRAWQNFLIGQGLYAGEANGNFDAGMKNATIAFQQQHSLGDDGVAGNKTLGCAMGLGFSIVNDDSTDGNGPNWPAPPPNVNPLVSTADRQRLFGTFTYVPAPTAGNPEGIRITNEWYAQNVERIVVPQLAGGRIQGAPKDGAIAFHKRGHHNLLGLFAAWEGAGLSDLILTWAGSYAPRFIRGSRTVLSNHAFATAFDINVPWNPLGAQPALADRIGSVRKLAALATENGFYWGGWFGRQDGMHFELFRADS